jgi:hypothetical protein
LAILRQSVESGLERVHCRFALIVLLSVIDHAECVEEVVDLIEIAKVAELVAAAQSVAPKGVCIGDLRVVTRDSVEEFSGGGGVDHA